MTSQPAPRKRAPRSEQASRSEQAARIVADEHVTFGQAADRLGITPQAVQYAWQRMFPDQDPPFRRRATRALELLRAGRTPAEAAAEVSLSEARVRSIARDAGISLPSRRVLRAMQFQEKFDEAAAAIRAGASIGEAAINHDVTYGALRRALARRRLASPASRGHQSNPPAPRGARDPQDQETSPGPSTARPRRKASGHRRTAADISVEERGESVCVYGYADGESEPVREVFRRADLPPRAGERRATESNLFNARCRIAAEINRRNHRRATSTTDPALPPEVRQHHEQGTPSEE